MDYYKPNFVRDHIFEKCISTAGQEWQSWIIPCIDIAYPITAHDFQYSSSMAQQVGWLTFSNDTSFDAVVKGVLAPFISLF